MFRPARRLALLVNMYDRRELFGPVGDTGAEKYHRFIPSRGNRSVFQMEAALRRGALDIRKELPLAGSRMMIP